MKHEIIFLLALLALAAAMVPRDRRAVNTEEEEQRLREQFMLTPPPNATKVICAPQTPCAWSIYKAPFKDMELNITNTYCYCSADTECKVVEDSTSQNAFVLRCRPPSYDEELLVS